MRVVVMGWVMWSLFMQPRLTRADAQPVQGDIPAETTETPDALSEEEREARSIAAFEASLDFKRGDVEVGDGLAKLALGNELRFLATEDSARLLEAWGNPPGAEPLGMILPMEISPFADDSWAVIVTYEEDGHIEDDDASDIDYDELLESMQQEAEESNEARTAEGYPAVHLVGWAEPPHYDANAKKLYWAKELDFGGEPRTLNYAIRVLGRKGVLQLNAVANMPQLEQMRSEMREVLGRVEFQEGNRYQDFDPELDEVAAYGLGALIAGKAAAKVGLFKGLIAFFLASKKLLIAGGVGLFAAVKGLLGRLRSKATGGSEESST